VVLAREVRGQLKVSCHGANREMTKRSFEKIMRAAGTAAGKIRRDHLPALTTTTIAVSLDPIELGALEVWIADQPDPKPTREEAARRLIAEALARK
jgi:hypothetical protein